MIDYNKKYIFIAKPDTWFDEGTEAIIEDGHRIWRSDEPNNPEEITLDEMLTYERISEHATRGGCQGIFQGIVDGKYDGEVCGLYEFNIIKIGDK